MSNAVRPFVPNALAGTPTLESELNSIIIRYGRDEVRKAVVKLAKGKKGRKQEKDWPIIGPEICRLDALDWLEGKDPFVVRTNYSIARDFASRYPGHSAASTHRRIMRKLKDKRQWYCEVTAWGIASKELPARYYFDVLSRLENLGEQWTEILSKDYDLRIGQLESYRERYGQPDDNMTFDDIEAKLAELRTNALAGVFAAKRGIFGKNSMGLLSQFSGSSNSDKNK